jgi:hypothetical protein
MSSPAPHGFAAISKAVGWDIFTREHFRPGQAPGVREALVAKLWAPRMVVVPAPPQCRFYFDRNANSRQDPGELSSGIRVHPLAADSLRAVLLEVRDAGLFRFIESCAGGYTYRPMTGSDGTKVSMHALGLAIDFDPKNNARGVPPSRTTLGSMPGLNVVRIFERHGWTSGIDFSTPNSMHKQFGSGY